MSDLHVPVKPKLVAVASVQGAPYNPPNRVAEAKLKDLLESMKKVGLLYPILIDPKNVIIDGHRRVAVAKLLGWPTIEARVVSEDRDEIYATVNVTAKRMSGNDALCVWCSNPKAVSIKQAERFDSMERRIGRVLVERIREAGFSARLFDSACRIARYCDDQTAETLSAIVRWLLDLPTVIRDTEKAMQIGQSPKIIMQAVQKRKPLKLQLAVGH